MLLTPLLQQSYWQVVLSTGRRLSERDILSNPQTQEPHPRRPADWTLDLISTDDILKVKEVHLIYPGFLTRPAALKIMEPGTVFQFKTASAMAFGANERRMEAQVIGRIDDKATGECTCWIWDRVLGLISYKTNIGMGDKTFGSWHPRIAPIQSLAHSVIGLRL
jgi:hypothetical protein